MGAICTTPQRSIINTESFGSSKKNVVTEPIADHHDSDDEEAIDSTWRKLPKYARDLIKTLEEEEEQVVSDLVDPILLTKIRKESITYEFVRDNGTKEVFRVSSLIDYMLATGHFHDPETRIDFTDQQLIDLDLAGEKLEETRDSVFAAKYAGDQFTQMKDNNDAFAGVDHLAGRYVSKMVRMIEKCKKDSLLAEKVKESLLVKIFPQYRHYVSLLFKLNREDTMVAVDQFKSFLVGPPNRPTRDRNNVLIPFCLNYFDEVMAELWREFEESEEAKQLEEQLNTQLDRLSSTTSEASRHSKASTVVAEVASASHGDAE